MVENVFLKIFFWWYNSVACVYFSQQLPLHLLLSKLIFMQLLWTNCLWTSQIFFPFYRPKSSALNNVWIHQHQLKNMSLSQQSSGIKMSNWTEEVIWNSCRVGLFNELSQAQKRGCFLCSTHFGSKLTNHGKAAELSILFGWKPWKKSVPVNFPASRGPFSFVFAELTDGTKRDLCHGSKWTVFSMRHGYLATETSPGAFSTWSPDDSHLSQLARQKTPAQFCCREWRVHQNPKKK